MRTGLLATHKRRNATQSRLASSSHDFDGFTADQLPERPAND
jgi:hypothetical protein